MSKMLIVPFLTLAFAACFIACGEVSVDQPATLQVQAAAPSPTPEYVPSDEQLDEWYDKSTNTLFKRWLAGEDLDGQFVDLDWSDEARKWVRLGDATVKVALFDSDEDGHKELAFQNGCAAVGNCVLHVYQRRGDSYRQILATSMVQRFQLRKTKTRGFYDLETSSHDSVDTGGIAIYKYDGRSYRVAKCFNYYYDKNARTKNGQSILHGEASLTSTKCDGL